VAERIVYAWILTIPMAGAIGALAYGFLLAIGT
jgi:phosphate/sulfate permease